MATMCILFTEMHRSSSSTIRSLPRCDLGLTRGDQVCEWTTCICNPSNWVGVHKPLISPNKIIAGRLRLQTLGHTPTSLLNYRLYTFITHHSEEQSQRLLHGDTDNLFSSFPDKRSPLLYYTNNCFQGSLNQKIHDHHEKAQFCQALRQPNS